MARSRRRHVLYGRQTSRFKDDWKIPAFSEMLSSFRTMQNGHRVGPILASKSTTGTMMNRSWPLPAPRVLFACFICLPACIANAQQERVRRNAPPEEWRWNIPDEIPGFVHATVHSDSMDRDVGYNIYLPPGYESDTDRRYPVVYYLHGASGSELSAHELGHVVRKLREEEKIGDVTYVFPNGGHFSRYRDWEDANVKAETWIIRELIPHIDATYRTIDAREGRALCGWSMGGDAALRFAFKYPEMFCAAATMSAAIDWNADGEDTIFGNSERNVERIRGRTGLLLVVGEEDRLFRLHQRLLPHLNRLEIDYEFKSLPGIGHNLGLIKEEAGEQVVLMLAGQYAAAR